MSNWAGNEESRPKTRVACVKMEVIWLQRPNENVPWGFRLQGGREFGQPLAVQRVVPGSVADGYLSSGDYILKIGNNNVTNAYHSEGQDHIRNAANTLQLTVKKVPRVAASCPVSPTSSQSFSFPNPRNPSSFRTFSPIRDDFSNYRSPRNMYSADDSENSRHFQSLPRHRITASGMHPNYSDNYDQNSFRRNDTNASFDRGCYTMPKPTPYRPSNVQTPSSHFRSGSSDSSGYQTSSYSPCTEDSPISVGSHPQRTSTSYQTSTPVNHSYGPAPGIPPPSYERSISERSQNSERPSYNRQGSSGRAGEDFEHRNDAFDTHLTSNGYSENVNGSIRSPHRLVRQSSRDRSGFNDYHKDTARGYETDTPIRRPNVISPSSDYSRSPSDFYRQPSYESRVHRPSFDSVESPVFNRHTPTSPNLSGNSIPRGFQKYNDRSFENDSRAQDKKPVLNYQRQSSSGTVPKYESSTISSPPRGHFSSQDGNKPEPPVRSHSFDHRVRKPSSSSSTGISCIEDILSPFEKFQNSNYFNEFYNKPNDSYASVQSGIKSDISDSSDYRTSSPSSGISPISQRKYQAHISSSYVDQTSPNVQQIVPESTKYEEPQSITQKPQMTSFQQVTPPPVAPPPPPLPHLHHHHLDLVKDGRSRQKHHTSNETRTPGDGSPVTSGQCGDKVPDAVLNTMLKQQGSGTPKPFAYITGGIDLKEFKQKRNRPPPPVMPKSYRGPDVEKNDEYSSPAVAHHGVNAVQSPPLRTQPQPQTQQYGYGQPQTQQYGQPQTQQYGQLQTQQYGHPQSHYGQSPQSPQYPRQYQSQSQRSPQEQTSPGVYRHAQYNSPIKVYSQTNAEEALRLQSGGAVTGVSGYPEKPPQDIQQSAVYKMVQESDGQGKRVLMSPEPEDSDKPRFLNQRKHGLSFRVLQWMTDTDDVDEDDSQDYVDSRKPRQPRDPLLRHNSVDDEMRFSGLNKKTDIPSKAFMKINQLSVNDAHDYPRQSQTENGDNNYDDSEQIGKYDQTSIRYTGKHIPSPSFRVLQRFADEAEQTAPPVTKKNIQHESDDLDDTDDGLPDTLSGDELTDKRYTGSNIPSRSFRMLQMSVGNGVEPHETHVEKQVAPEPSEQQVQQKPKITIITRSKAVSSAPEVPEDIPSTDF